MTTPRVFLAAGAHPTSEDGLCAMEWVSWAAGEAHSDAPQCVSPVIRKFCIGLNDRLPDDLRQRLIPVLLSCVGTDTGRADDRTRAYLCADWAVRELLPLYLERRGNAEQARSIRRIPAIVDRASAKTGRKAADAAAYAAAAYAAYAADAADAAADAADAADAAAYAAAYAADAATCRATWEALLPGALALIERMCAVGRKPMVLDEARCTVLLRAVPEVV